MVLDIGRALRTGVDQLVSETGVVVAAVLLAFHLGYGVVLDSLRRELAAVVYTGGPPGGPGVGAVVASAEWPTLPAGLSLPVLAALALAGIILNEVIRFWAIRTFAGPSATRAGDAGARLRVLFALGGGVTLLVFTLQHVFPVLGLLWGVETMTTLSRGSVVLSLLLVGVAVYLRQEIALSEGSVRETFRNSVTRFLRAPVPILGLSLLHI
jgi:hypothetical protein